MDIFKGLVAVFDFIYSLLDTIINGIRGITSIITNIINLILSLIRILPTSLYLITFSFVGVFSVVFIFKLIKH